MPPARMDYESLHSRSEALEHLARGTIVQGIPDAEIEELWADVQRLEIDASLSGYLHEWSIIPTASHGGA